MMSPFETATSMIARAVDVTIVEVGANDGSHTRQFLDLFPTGRVYCFEPDPRASDKFRRAVESPRATLVEKAVGKTTGHATFYQSGGQPPDPGSRDWSRGWDESGSIRAPKLHLDVYPWVKFETKLGVEMIRLDDWAASAGVGRIDLVWADVQGAEEDLIEGARETLARTHLFATEYSRSELYENAPSLDRILSLLPDFEVVADWPNVHDGNLLLRNRLMAEVAGRAT